MSAARVCVPGTGGCSGTANIARGGRGSALLLGDASLRFRWEAWRQDLRVGHGRSITAVVECVASDASSVEVKDSGNVDVEEAKEDPADDAEAKDSLDSAAESDEEKDSSEKEGKGSSTYWQNFQAIRARRLQDWKRAESFQKKGGIFQAKIESFNQGGVVLRFYSLRGFLPYSQLSLARLPRDTSKTVMDVGKELIGKSVPVLVIEADRKKRKLVFSERKALWSQFGSKIQIGNVLDGQVTGIVDYGAFVDIRYADGTYPAVGLVHVKEISWDTVTNPRDVLSVGQDVKVKVTGIDEESMRLALSIRQLEPDPLMETLDTLMPKDSSTEPGSSDSDEQLLNSPLPGIDKICEELEKESGVTAVTLGRQKLEKHVVSQDLELWLSQGPVEDGHITLLARAGRQVQEVHVTTSLGRDEMKVAVKRVTQKIP
ncbi:uncharacterized protein LOC9651696 [Selaginella moellendorffii]|nr:uncharacterized protein LOC9651696 [Selaginella moellendorffii]|eukprot:XP_002972390.2 uncharacterized protein LOC9651696 [Selaginella moellendorffii]